MQGVNPYLNFPGNTEEAFRFYQSVFGGELQLTRFGDFPDNSMGVPEEHLNKIANIALPLTDGSVLMATDALESFGPKFTPGNNFSIALETDSAEEAEELFTKLSEGGNVNMPLSGTEWAEKFGACTDKFGVQWMLNYTGNVQFTAGEQG